MKISFIPREEHFHRSILLHWVIKKKKKRNESIIRGVLTEGRFVSLNISINSIDSGIFRLDKKRECLNRGIELDYRSDNVNIP